MGMFDLFRRSALPVARREPVVTVPSGPARVVRYSGASQKARFGDFSGYNGRSADAELNQALSILRNRSRMLYRDNPHARRYINLRGDNIVGASGFSVSVSAVNTTGRPDDSGNTRVETAWNEWCKSPSANSNLTFAEVCRLVDTSRARDGDVFVEMVMSDNADKFGLIVHEADMVDETLNRPSDGKSNAIKMGVEVNHIGKPVAYHFWTYHRGDPIATDGTRAHRRVSVENIIHVYKTTRPGQTRGEPDMVAVMTRLKMVEGYREAEVTGRRLRSSIGGWLESDLPDSNSVEEMADRSDASGLEMDVEAGQVRGLPPGVKFKAFDPTTGNDDGSKFVKGELQAISVGLNVSYPLLANDLEAVSFSSIRAGTIADQDTWIAEQAFLIGHFVMPVFKKWLRAWFNWNPDSLPFSRYEKFVSATTFSGRRWKWVDPLKDVSASIEEIDAGLTSYSRLARERGIDFAELVRELAADQALLKAAGVTIGQIKNGNKLAADEQDDEDAKGGSGVD